MLKIEVFDPVVSEKSGTSQRTNKAYRIREQEAFAHVVGPDGKPGRYPVRMTVTLEADQQPYPPGVYGLGDISFRVGDFGALQIARVHLVPIAELKGIKAA